MINDNLESFWEEEKVPTQKEKFLPVLKELALELINGSEGAFEVTFCGERNTNYVIEAHDVEDASQNVSLQLSSAFMQTIYNQYQEAYKAKQL